MYPRAVCVTTGPVTNSGILGFAHQKKQGYLVNNTIRLGLFLLVLAGCDEGGNAITGSSSIPAGRVSPNRKIFEARKRETAALGAGEKLVLGHPLAATIGDSARCMQNLEKVLFNGAKDLRHGDVYLRLGLALSLRKAASESGLSRAPWFRPFRSTPVLLGDIEAIVNWTFPTNDLDIGIARGSCTCALLSMNACTEIASSESTTAKPERVTALNQPAGAYTLVIANFGARSDSGSYQVILTR